MKLFTVEEANALLPELRHLLEKIQEERNVLRRLEPEIKMAGERASEGGGTSSGVRYVTALSRITDYAQTILSLGVQIKDFDRGLCDFPHLREDRVVFLCWQYGEDHIEWWHDVDAGFAGRQRL
ncbi:MAG TPA: DUF2203 domain-containing protein [Blastocatellia bacterium]|nr:DUF2203 domain-containing protein [Blastocatellia bacterium]